MIGTSETWLKPTIDERESLSESYRFVARRDRPNSSHGGVAVIAWHDLEAPVTDLHSTAEIVAASFTCKDLKKSITVGSLYLQSRFRDHILWNGGDANLPDTNMH